MNLTSACRRAASSAVLLSSLLVVGGRCLATAGKYDLVVPLKFVPTNADEVVEEKGILSVSGPPFEILPAVDSRPGPHDLLGMVPERWMKNPASTGPRYEKVDVSVRAASDVAAWITRSLSDSLRDWGTASMPGASLVLHTELVTLLVREVDNTYQGEAAIKFSLKKRDGTEVWVGLVGGADSRWGLSLSKENYQETLSDAVFSCYAKLWVDPGFREAWAGKMDRQAAQVAGAATKPAPPETLDPDVALKKALSLKEAGFQADALIAWVRKIAFTRPLTSDDMLAWKAAGVPPAVITAAME